MTAWWSGRSRREQVLLGVMLIGISLFVLWYGLAVPLRRAVEAAERREAQAAAVLAEVEAAARQIEALRRTGAATSTDLISQTAAAADVPLARVDAVDEGAVSVSVESARSNALFGWLTGLQTQHGVFARQLDVNRNSDGTLRAELVLRGAGR